MSKKRTFSKEEKLLILREASEQGVKPTLEKHSIYPATYYSWRSKFNQLGEQGLEHGIKREHIKRIRQLEKDLQGYKELVAEKELQIRMHETIKK